MGEHKFDFSQPINRLKLSANGHGLPAESAAEIKELYADGATQQEIAARYGVSQPTISYTLNRRKSNADNIKYISINDAIKTAWMILEGLGYPRRENPQLAQTVRNVFNTAPVAIEAIGTKGDTDAAGR